MAGYINRFIDIGFPELGGLDDNGRANVWVKIRNPRLIPGDDLLGAASKVRLDPDTGMPTEVDVPAATGETFKTFAKLVIAGHVWDATWIPTNFDDDTEDAPLLSMPPSPADMGKFPIEILNAIGKELKNATPR